MSGQCQIDVKVNIIFLDINNLASKNNKPYTLMLVNLCC
ncbi:hypothetical protein VIBNISFn118_160026 [Vibrio nigripulchritudo SFn118]|nr:hypothetical protein VIBNISFn118_160026 [Vibrio nigripulchritudo SFn118]